MMLGPSELNNNVQDISLAQILTQTVSRRETNAGLVSGCSLG